MTGPSLRVVVDDYVRAILPSLERDLQRLGVEVVSIGCAPAPTLIRALGEGVGALGIVGGIDSADVRRRLAAVVAQLARPVPLIAVLPHAALDDPPLRGPHIVDILGPDTVAAADRVLLMAAIPVVSDARARRPAPAREGAGAREEEAPAASAPRCGVEGARRIVAIASSTGGTSIVAQILRALDPPRSESVLVAQHIQADFVQGFVEWLAEDTGWNVRVVEGREPLDAGVAYVAAGGMDLCVDGDEAYVAPALSPLMPNADRLFRSVATCGGARRGAAVGIVLSGMGSDGAAGLAALAAVGGRAFCQAPETAAIASMPLTALRTVPAARAYAPSALSRAIRDAWTCHL